jgi:hypothetical protein
VRDRTGPRYKASVPYWQIMAIWAIFDNWLLGKRQLECLILLNREAWNAFFLLPTMCCQSGDRWVISSVGSGPTVIDMSSQH